MNIENTKLCGMAALLMAALCAVCLGQDNPVVSKLFSDHKGLMVGSKKDQAPVQEVPGGKLKQFAVAAAGAAAPNGLEWYWAEAVIDGDTVVVSCPEAPKPVAVHDAYSRNPEGCNLYKKDGLPASPFRTED